MRIKEHRLLWRDPWLISQIMLQALYTLPIGIVLWRHGGVVGAPGVAFGPMLVVIAGQLAGSLAWLALSAEDAPDFLATAPATRGELDRAKLTAILMPVALFMGAPLLGLTWIAPFGGCAAILGSAGAAASGALLMLWRQAPARRGMVLRRHSQSKLVALGEHWLSLLWACATAVAAFGSFACVAPLVLISLTLWLIRPARPRPLTQVIKRATTAEVNPVTVLN
jgi:ABC-2 type transport system permease protein